LSQYQGTGFKPVNFTLNLESFKMRSWLVSKRFYLAIIFCLVFTVATRAPLDTDMWWHLRAGEQTWQTGRPVTVDIFSYTRQGESWINHSWLSQVGMYLIYRLGGFLALGAFVTLLAVISMGFVYAQMEGHPLMRGFVLILASAVAAKVWSPRPQLVSLVLFGLQVAGGESSLGLGPNLPSLVQSTRWLCFGFNADWLDDSR
jgi:hypothetical protein